MLVVPVRGRVQALSFTLPEVRVVTLPTSPKMPPPLQVALFPSMRPPARVRVPLLKTPPPMPWSKVLTSLFRAVASFPVTFVLPFSVRVAPSAL